MSDRIDVREFLAGYLAESEEHLGSANANLLLLDAALKKGDNHPRAVRELFRALHTMKGISAMIGADPIVDIAHEMESVLRVVDRSGARLPVSAIDVLLRGVRAIEERVAKLGRGETFDSPKALLVELATLVNGPTTPAAISGLVIPADIDARMSAGEREQLAQGLKNGSRIIRVDFVPSPAHVAAGLTITSVRQRMGALGDLVKVAPLSRPLPGGGTTVAFGLLLLTTASDEDVARAVGLPIEQLSNVSGPTAPELPAIEDDDPLPSPDAPRSNFIRVDVRRLDEALERLSALVVAHAKLQQLVSGQDRALSAVVSEAGRYLRDLRGSIMRARMVPASDLLDRAPLIVRGLIGSSGKQVKLQIEPSQVELDKAVADRLFPVLVHLLRNAVDHAIETPAERAKLGKPESGTIRIACTQAADGFLEVTLSDDGRGIDRARIAERAGADVPQTSDELLALLTRPGFSTLDVATSVSGRGFGMDIVQRSVTELGGEIAIETQVGKGTTFSLRVPVSLTIIDVLTFACADQMFVVPVRSVERLTELQSLPSVAPPRRKSGGSRAARLTTDGEHALPLYDLSALIGLARTPNPTAKVIIVRRGEERFGFEVDRMIGRKEVVMRPLNDPLVHVPGVAGTTDLGDGRPTLVLDLLALIRGRTAGAEELS